MKKIISISCLCIFICINIINPIKVFAYNEEDMNTEVNPPLTNQQFYDSYTGSIIAASLQNGGSIYIPKGFHVDDLYTNVYDIAENFLDSFIDNYYDDYQDYFMRHPPTTIGVDSSYAWAWEDDYHNNSMNMPSMAYDILNDFLNQDPEFPLPEDPVNPNYLPYIELINGKSFNYQYYLTDNWFTTLSDSDIPSNLNYITIVNNPNSISYFTAATTRPKLSDWNSTNTTIQNRFVASYNSNDQKYKISADYCFESVSIYINLVNNEYQCTCSALNPTYVFHNNTYGNMYRFGLNYDTSTHKITSIGSAQYTAPSVTWQYSGSSLEDCFKIIAMHWRNVNIYVDGNLWSSINRPTEPIAIGGNTYFPQTDTQVQYKYPDGTYFNPNILKSILRQLIESNNTENGIYVKMDDILEAFTDINGNTAVYTLVVHRNDYDQLIIEQYGNKRITTQNGLLFPKDDIQPYTNVSTYITQSSISLIPTDILSILGACGILILIAYLINRLLE